MSWIDEVLDLLPPRTAGEPERGLDYDRMKELAGKLRDGLSRVRRFEEARDVLAASSLLLRLGAIEGDLFLPDWSDALREMGSSERSRADIVVLGLGEPGQSLLLALASSPLVAEDPARFRKIFLDTETSRDRDLDPDTIPVVLESFPRSDTGRIPRYGELLRASYRAVAGSRGLPPLIAETIEASSSATTTVHVVAGAEDPWVALLPDLLFDLRSYLGWGRRGTCILHLVSRPSPRLRGTYLEVLQEVERTRPFDQAFVVYAAAPQARVDQVAAYIVHSARVPELFFTAEGDERRGVLSSYGAAPLPLRGGDDTVDEYLSRLDSAFRAAAPAWRPINVVLSEIAPERVFCIHPPDVEPDESLWKLCPELTLVPLDGVEPTLWRVQSGLALGDLRLGQ